MRFTALLPAFLASALVAASPEIKPILDSLAEDEIHVFKRDTIVTTRDIELAERHNIDLNKMYKHSIIKRDDEDHVTIWVAKNFIEGKDREQGNLNVALTKRQRLRIWDQNRFSDDSPTGICSVSGHHLATGRTWHSGDTGPNAPFTGGANAIINWGLNCKAGRWYFGESTTPGTYYNLVVAGTNSGFNMRFTVESRLSMDGFTEIGCRDVGLMTLQAKNAHQRNINGWRVRAYGGFSCILWPNEQCFKSFCPDLPTSQPFNWWIDRSIHSV